MFHFKKLAYLLGTPIHTQLGTLLLPELCGGLMAHVAHL